MALRVRRIYEPASAEDGVRVLVDRIWPRGVSKEMARVDLWLKEAAPSTALRQWFAHDPAKWEEFVRRYHAELRGRADEVKQIRGLARKGRVTLLYAARDEEHNNAVALAAFCRS